MRNGLDAGEVVSQLRTLDHHLPAGSVSEARLPCHQTPTVFNVKSLSTRPGRPDEPHRTR